MTSKRIKSIAVFALLLFISLLITQAVLASTYDQVLSGYAKTGSAAGYPQGSNGAPKKDFNAAFSNYVSGFAIIIGAFFMILVIYAGYLWMTARGEEQQVERAKKMLIGSLIGLGIVLGGRIIVELWFGYLGNTLDAQ